MRFLLALLLSATLTSCVTAKRARPDRTCPDEVVSTGFYRNYNYGFSVVFPPELAARWNSAACAFDEELGECVCMSDHGRTAELPGGGHIVLFAAFSMPDDAGPLPNQLLCDINRFRGSADDFAFRLLEVGPVRLGPHDALHYIASLTILGSEHIREAIIADTPDGHIKYTVAIEAPTEEYRHYRPAFLAITASWRARPRA